MASVPSDFKRPEIVCSEMEIQLALVFNGWNDAADWERGIEPCEVNANLKQRRKALRFGRSHVPPNLPIGVVKSRAEVLHEWGVLFRFDSDAYPRHSVVHRLPDNRPQ
ncbi:MAG TPA: hypothetical protein PKN33_16010 [Phycisphaerae bacterium]|nr:hypothetical protein [Phycisphaerae bacterium]